MRVYCVRVVARKAALVRTRALVHIMRPSLRRCVVMMMMMMMLLLLLLLLLCMLRVCV
jgi:hypothetical protein